jgi:hypothetical protein
MSDSYREQNNKAKAVRLGIVEQRPVSGKRNKPPKPWKVFGPCLGKADMLWHRAASLEECEQWLAKERRRRCYVREDWTQEKIAASAARLDANMARFRIVGPA